MKTILIQDLKQIARVLLERSKRSVITKRVRRG